MPEQIETTIFPIIKNILEDSTDEEELSDNRIVALANKICKRIEEKYKIEKK